MSRVALILLLLIIAACKKEPSEELQKPPGKKVVYRTDMSGMLIDTALISKKKHPLLHEFYRLNKFQTYWYDALKRKMVTDAILRAEAEGLQPKDYELDTLIDFEKKIGKIADTELIRYDIKFTNSIQRLLLHVSRGKLNPRDLYWNWDLRTHRANINKMIYEGVSGDSLPNVVSHAAPKNAMYEGLREALAWIEKLPDDRKLKKVRITKKLTRNDTSKVIIDVKRRLIYWKDLPERDSLTRIYDKRTFLAVQKFQKRHGLEPDGVIGKGTASAMNVGKSQRRRQIVANLERWRWFPRYLGNHYFLVNIPAYTLHVVRKGDTIEEKKIIVGKNDRRTPVLSSSFSSITFNPTWTVPRTILKEDLIPSATKDRGYFLEKNITIFDWKNNEIDPYDWKPDKPQNYKYVQPPGDHNSLGNVKFNFPNHYTVYLHDTNNKSYFQQNFRSLSSGCVRVEEPLPLAVYMLNDERHWPIDSVLKVVETKETKIIKLKDKIRIHQLYYTAWAENGVLNFRDDIYSLDEPLYEALRK